jgi:hypothetical protein
MKIERVWSMPNKWTFTIKPIAALLKEEVGSGMFVEGLWVDPFAGENSPAQITNDLNQDRPTTHHMDALDFLRSLGDNSADGALFDPPYSPRQVKEMYEGIGIATVADHTRMDFWSKCKDEIRRIVKPNGKVICFGWNTMGMGKSRGFVMQRILLVPHGGNKNDTLVTVETKLPTKA